MYLISMSNLIQPLYPWSKPESSIKNRNQGLGSLISLNFIFLYFLLFIYVSSGKIYPALRLADINLLGHLSALVIGLRYLVFNWWLSIILFFVSLAITITFTSLITKTKPSLFKTYIEYIKLDTKNLKKNEIVKQIFVNLLEIAGFSIISFLFLELITFAISSLATTIILPTIVNITEVSLSYVFLTILISHILFFPLLIFFYNRMVMKKLVKTDKINLKRFLTEDGEVDMDKWKNETWGKKPYTFDWEEEEVFPITCFSCGSIISSDLTVCPICDADLIKEIEIIEDETTDDSERENSEENENNSDTDK